MRQGEVRVRQLFWRGGGGGRDVEGGGGGWRVGAVAGGDGNRVVSRGLYRRRHVHGGERAAADRVAARVEQVLRLLVGNVDHELLRLGAMGFPDLTVVGRQRDGGEYRDDRHDDHHFNNGEAALRRFHLLSPLGK